MHPQDLIGSTENAFVLNYMNIFICSLFKCIMLLKIAFMVIELAKEISFQADPLPQIYYFYCNVSRVTNKIEIFPFSKPVCCIIF